MLKWDEQRSAGLQSVRLLLLSGLGSTTTRAISQKHALLAQRGKPKTSHLEVLKSPQRPDNLNRGTSQVWANTLHTLSTRQCKKYSIKLKMKQRTVRNYAIGAAVVVVLIYAFSQTETGEAAIQWLPWKHASPEGISGYTPPAREFSH